MVDEDEWELESETVIEGADKIIIEEEESDTSQQNTTPQSSKLETEIENLRESIESRFDSLRTQVENKPGTEELRNQLAQLKQAVEEIEATNDRRTELEAKIDELQTQLTNLESQVGSETTRGGAVTQAQYEELMQAVEELKTRETTGVGEEVAKIQKQLSNIETQVGSETTGDLTSIEDRLRKIEENLRTEQPVLTGADPVEQVERGNLAVVDHPLELNKYLYAALDGNPTGEEYEKGYFLIATDNYVWPIHAHALNNEEDYRVRRPDKVGSKTWKVLDNKILEKFSQNIDLFIYMHTHPPQTTSRPRPSGGEHDEIEGDVEAARVRELESQLKKRIDGDFEFYYGVHGFDTNAGQTVEATAYNLKKDSEFQKNGFAWNDYQYRHRVTFWNEYYDYYGSDDYDESTVPEVVIVDE
jgi:hypothetical protein